MHRTWRATLFRETSALNVHANIADVVADPSVAVERDGARVVYVAGGEWTGTHAVRLRKELDAAAPERGQAVVCDLRAVTRMDTAGAWLFERMRESTLAGGGTFETRGETPQQRILLEAVRQDGNGVVGKPVRVPFLERTGRATAEIGSDMLMAMHVLGAALRGPQSQGTGNRFRVTSIVHQLHQMGLRAVPVVVLMNFLVGGIVAQQAAFQLKYYGEEILTASLVGLLVLREVGVLLTAILVAGRTGSAITAEIGTMKMREETDALTVMGLNPIGVLVFPRLLALIIAMPLLTILANFAGIFGAMVMTNLYVAVPPELFLDALRGYIDHTTIGSGLIKAPFMALIIGLISAVEGLKVGGSAESLGQRVTASVVKGIFMVIVVDGFFAVFYAAIDY